VAIDQQPHPDQSTATDDCWSRIGVMGDGSCPELAEAVHCRNCAVFQRAGQRLFEREPPAQYVDEQTSQLARRSDDEASDTVAVLVFRIDREWLALDVGVVAEVADPRAVHRIPHRSSQLLMGLVNIRGELQLCISLPALLGIDGRPGEESLSASATSRLLVVEYNQQTWVFPVDEVAGVWRVGVDKLGNVPATVAIGPKRFSRAVFAWEGKKVGYLADDRLLQSLEGSVG
jgi:chemotaxis-related protein WspD